MTLAIETSHEPGVLGLWRGEECLAERSLSTQKNRAQNLVITIRELLAEQGLKPGDCELISVGTGPGSFTGLRVGIVCAKTLAYACQSRIAGVPTLRGLAENCPAEISRVTCVIDAQREEVFAQTFSRNSAGDWEETGEIRILPFDEWGARLTTEDAVLGPALTGRAERLQGKCVILDQGLWHPSARSIALLGQREEFQKTCWEVLPFYVRKSAAEETWERRQLSSADSSAVGGNQ